MMLKRGRKPSMGRQKIEIKKIEKEESRQVCFCKRKAGVFKKANELSILCGAEIGIVVFSRAGKSFSYGHPSVDSVASRFLDGDPSSAGEGPGAVQRRGAAAIGELNMQCVELEELVEKEKRRKAALEAAVKGLNKGWWDLNVEDLELEELEECWRVMDELERSLARRNEELLMESAASRRMLPATAGSSSWLIQNPVVFKNEERALVLHPHHGFGYGPPTVYNGIFQMGNV